MKYIMPLLIMFSRDDVFGSYHDWFTQHDLTNFGGLLKKIGFAICKFMAGILDKLYEAFKELFKLITFTNDYSTVQAFIGNYRGLMFAIMGLVIVVLALMIIFGSEEIKASQVLQNIITGIVILLVIPNIMNLANLALIEYAKVEINLMESSAGQTMKSHVYDLQYLFSDENYNTRINGKNGYTDETIWMITPDEYVIGRENPGYDDIFKYEYDPSTGTSEKVIKDMKIGDNNLDFMNGWYYRYKFDLLPVFLFYIGEILMMVLVILKTIRLIIEILVGRLFTEVLSITDIGTGQRLKGAIRYVISAYITLAYVFTSVVLYHMFITFVDASISNDFTKVVVGAMATVAFIDGPNLVERIFGIDAGLKSVFHTLMGASRIAQGAARLATGAVKTAASGAARGAKALATAKDRATENEMHRDQLKNYREQKQAEKQGSGSSGNTNSASNNGAANPRSGATAAQTPGSSKYGSAVSPGGPTGASGQAGSAGPSGSSGSSGSGTSAREQKAAGPSGNGPTNTAQMPSSGGQASGSESYSNASSALNNSETSNNQSNDQSQNSIAQQSQENASFAGYNSEQSYGQDSSNNFGAAVSPEQAQGTSYDQASPQPQPAQASAPEPAGQSPSDYARQTSDASAGQSNAAASSPEKDRNAKDALYSASGKPSGSDMPSDKKQAMHPTDALNATNSKPSGSSAAESVKSGSQEKQSQAQAAIPQNPFVPSKRESSRIVEQRPASMEGQLQQQRAAAAPQIQTSAASGPAAARPQTVRQQPYTPSTQPTPKPQAPAQQTSGTPAAPTNAPKPASNRQPSASGRRKKK